MSRLRTWRPHILALSVHLGLALVLCWHAVRSGGREVVGKLGTETWVFLWGHGWTRQALMDQGQFPFRTQLLDFPDGGVLWLKDPLGTVSMLPAQHLFGIPAAATLWTVLLFALAGVCSTALLRALGTPWLGAVLGGALYLLCPHALGEAINANTEALAGFTLPLWLWALLAVVRRPTRLRAAGAAGALWLLLVGNQYFALCMIPVSAVVLPLALWARPAPARARATLGALGATATGALGFAPVALAIQRSLAAPDKLNELPPPGEIILNAPYLFDATLLFDPSWSDPTPGAGGPVPFVDLIYPGWLAVGLLVLGLALRPRLLAGWLCLLGTLGFGLLSLGPALRWQDAFFPDPDTPLWLPWVRLVELPLLEGMSLPARMATPTGLGIALGAGLGLGAICRWGWPGRGAALALGLLAAAEMLVRPGLALPLPTVPVPRSQHTQLLRQAEAPGAVLDLPMNRGNSHLRVTLWYQTQHRRPMQGSLKFARPALAQRDAMAGALWELDKPAQVAVVLAQGQAQRLGMQGLAQEGFAYVVLHHGFLAEDPDTTAAMQALLDLDGIPSLTPPDGQTEIWGTTPAAATALARAAQELGLRPAAP